MIADAGRDLVTRLLAPIAARLPNVNPNHLTAAGFGVSCAGGVAFAQTDGHPAWFLVAAGLGAVFAAIDALDGAIARAHGKESAWGDFLDHTSDRLAALVALGGLACTAHANRTLALLVMIGTLWHAYLGTQMHASFGARVYRGVGIAESLAFALVYTLTAFTIRATGLPFHFHEPLTGARLSVTDAFALVALPLIVIGTIQRLRICRVLSREGPPR